MAIRELFQRAVASANYRIFGKQTKVYSQELILRDDCTFGEYTYGEPAIEEWGEGKKLIVGKFCSIAKSTTFFLGGNHRTDWITTYPFNILNTDFPNAMAISGHPASKGDIVIGNDVWIAHGVSIFSGVTVGDGAVIGAFSVVTKDVDPYTIVAGNPAKAVKSRFNDEEVRFLLRLKWWDWPSEKINENVNLLLSPNLDDLMNKFGDESVP